jgi:tRNA(Arg) A34 adenosine deaminase TadA
MTIDTLLAANAHRILPALAAELREAFGALEADAARWAAFRNAVVSEDESFLEAIQNYPFEDNPASHAEVDAAIDAARKETS